MALEPCRLGEATDRGSDGAPTGHRKLPETQCCPSAEEPPPLRDRLSLRLGTPTPPLPGADSESRGAPPCKPQAYLLADLTHGEVLVVTGACHTDVLEPAAGPGLIRVHTELLAAQLFRDLPRKKEHRDGSEASS